MLPAAIAPNRCVAETASKARSSDAGVRTAVAAASSSAAATSKVIFVVSERSGSSESTRLAATVTSSAAPDSKLSRETSTGNHSPTRTGSLPSTDIVMIGFLCAMLVVEVADKDAKGSAPPLSVTSPPSSEIWEKIQLTICSGERLIIKFRI